MRFRFITILHNMKLDSIKNKGLKVNSIPGARISNGPQVLNDTLYTKLMYITLGEHSINEFEDRVYFYQDGEFEGLNRKEIEEVGVKHTFFFLRQVQNLIHNLWEIKDNNIYVRDGFLLVYNSAFEDGVTFKASLSEIFTLSSGEQSESLFSDIEISNGISNLKQLSIDDYGEDSIGGKYPNSDHLYKSHGSNRIERTYYFVLGARRSAILPLKIVYYCNALECLFTVGSSEVNHKIAERVAVMLGDSSESKKKLFKLIKKAYNYRSTLVHGQHLKGTEEPLISISKALDDILRKLIVAKANLFSMSDQEMEDYFLDLIFQV